MSNSAEVAIIGVGIHPFGRYEDRSALEMGAVAITRALSDAGVEWSQVGNLSTVALAQLYGAPGAAAVAVLSR